MSGMDGLDRRLRDLLDAAAGEPPPDMLSVAAVRRRVIRRRALECVAGAAAVAVIAVAIPAGLGVFGHLSRPAEPTQRPPAHALYVYSYVFTCCGAFGGSHGTVTPVNTATNTPGTPIHVGAVSISGGGAGEGAGQIVITPGGKTAYATTGPTVTPISTATNTPGKRVTVATGGFGNLGQIVITPDGKTVYVTTGSSVTPISTATATPGKPIHVGVPGLGAKSLFRLSVPAGSLSRFLGRIVITPDGKTAYVSTGSSVTPISTATGTPGKPIHVGGIGFQAMVIKP